MARLLVRAGYFRSLLITAHLDEPAPTTDN